MRFGNQLLEQISAKMDKNHPNIFNIWKFMSYNKHTPLHVVGPLIVYYLYYRTGARGLKLQVIWSGQYKVIIARPSNALACPPDRFQCYKGPCLDQNLLSCNRWWESFSLTNCMFCCSGPVCLLGTWLCPDAQVNVLCTWNITSVVLLPASVGPARSGGHLNSFGVSHHTGLGSEARRLIRREVKGVL